MPPHPSSSWRATAAELAREVDLLLLDLDGVVYVGRQAVPQAVESLDRAVRDGLRARYVTNNASRPPDVVAEHLRELGIAAADDEVVTSAQEGAELLATRVRPGSRILAVGGPGVPWALREAGLTPVTSYDETVSGVLQGYGPEVGWADLAEASYAVAAGAVWVATNPDLTVPTPRGTAPGNGQLTAVVARTTGIDPMVTGKPGPGLFRTAIRRAGARRALVVGDRLDTDIAGAVAGQLDSLLVLTGVSGLVDLLRADRAERPTYLARDLTGLWQTQPAVELVGEWWVCRAARARVVDERLELSRGRASGLETSASEPAQPGVAELVSSAAGDEQGLDTWRAAAAAVWAARDGGHRVDLDAAVAAVARPAR